MHGSNNSLCHLRVEPDAPLLCNAKLLAEERLCGGGPQQNKNTGLDDLQLGRQPRQASLDLARVRLFVQPPLTLRFPFEMLYGIGDIGELPVNARLRKCPVE